MTIDSEPYFEGFNPYIIPMQGELMDLLEDWNYDESTPEILLSGAYGSSKSIVVAHICISHCIGNNSACVFIGRRSLPDLKKTFFKEICDHLDGSLILEEGKHYIITETKAEIYFPITRSKIIGGSWADRKYKKFRSLKISLAVFEEAAENDLEDKEAFLTIKARLRRIPQMKGKQNALIAITNPDAPEHWLYEYFIEGEKNFPSRKVLYSVTSDNPFLDEVYKQQLLNDLDPKQARRYIYGEWLSLVEEVIYSTYDPDHNFSASDYEINSSYPIGFSTDFNIGEGKPMSWVFFQYIDDHFHFFDEVVIYSARTENALEEAENRGLLSYDNLYQIFGDAAGKHRSTNSKRSDYQIIYDYLERLGVTFEKKVLPSNPPIRKRHNIVRSYCLNALGKRRLTVYKKCKMLDKGFKLTKLKKGAGYIEDDSASCPWQHVTTAAGYGIYTSVKAIERKTTERYL